MKVSMLVRRTILWVVLAVFLATSASEVVAAPNGHGRGRSYLVIGKEGVPLRLRERVEQFRGRIVEELEDIGVAVVESSEAGFAAAMEAGSDEVESVVPNIRLQWIHPSVGEVLTPAGEDERNFDGWDYFFPAQWGLQAIHAPEAWELGARGQGVRVAVLDTGMYRNPDITPPMHPDLEANVNTELARSFVPGEEVWNPDGSGRSWHGTYVAGLIAAADNVAGPEVPPPSPFSYDDTGIIGVAPEAEIVPIKVLEAATGEGEFAWLLKGLLYAAEIKADVINMSLAGRIPLEGYLDDNGTPDPSDDFWVGRREVMELLHALNRALGIAHRAGATLVAAAGNDAEDLDLVHDEVVMPAEGRHVIAVSATAPELWVFSEDPDFDIPTSYTNYGRSVIHLAAPGGDMDMFYSDDPRKDEIVAVVPTPGVEVPAWGWDLVIGPFPPFSWLAGEGTSFAAPHVSGVAAMIIGVNGGDMNPIRVQLLLQLSADDKGDRGWDPYFGRGRVNALRATRYAQLVSRLLRARKARINRYRSRMGR